MLSGSIITYSAPSAPVASTSRLHRRAAYTRCLRCAYSHMPRQPTTGSELSLMLFRNMSPSETSGNFSAAPTQFLHRKHWPSTLGNGFGIPNIPHPPIHVRETNFGAGLRFAYATTCCFVSPPVGADQIFIQPTRTFTSGLSMVWSPSPPPDITTVPTGKLALAGLSPTRTSTSFTALPNGSGKNQNG